MQQSQEMMMVIGLVVALLLMMMQKQHTNRGTNPFWQALDKCRETAGPKDPPCMPSLCRGTINKHAMFPCRGLNWAKMTYSNMVDSFGGKYDAPSDKKKKMDDFHNVLAKGLDTWIP